MNNIPYTYLIGWSKHDIWYYGVRYAKNCHPDDLWVEYKTSSKYVTAFTEKHGEPDVVQVRKTFTDSATARLWEEKVLSRMKVIRDDKWLNKTNNRAFVPMYGTDNPMKRPDVMEKHRSVTESEEWRTKMRIANNLPETVIKRSGKNHYSKKEDYESKIIGENNPMKREEVIEKMKQSLPSRKGELNPSSILCEQDIIDIRSMFFVKPKHGQLKLMYSYLSEKYGVGENTIRAIRNRQIWKHV